MPVIDLFDRATSLAPTKAFLIGGTSTWTHSEASLIIDCIAGGLAKNGCGIGSKVGVWTPNCAEGFLAMMGIFRSGSTWVPVQARNSWVDNVAYLERLRVDALFVHSSVVGDADALCARLPQLRVIIGVDRPVGALPSVLSWADQQSPAPRPLLRPHDTFALLGTGGTTGAPKAAVLTQQNLHTEIANFLIAMPPVDRDHVNLLATPMTHGAGFTAFPLLGVGATQVVLHRAAAPDVLDAIERHRVTHLFLPPTVVYDMLADPSVRDRDFSSLRHLIYAAAPMSVDKLREALDVFGPVMTQVYGQAEAPLMCTFLGPDDHRIIDGDDRRLWSCGRATTFTPVTVLNDLGDEMPTGQDGEIAVRGDLVMAGYYEDPEATAQVTSGPWHRTGDIGHLDDEGYVYVVDRKRDMIISGGFNIFPSEVEQAVWGHESVKDCAVVGAPHERWGEEVTAVVELKPGAQLTAEELIAFARQRLGSLKAPKRVEIWPELPRSAVGKVLRRTVRDHFWDGRQRAI